MVKRIATILAVGVTAVITTASLTSRVAPRSENGGVTVHEWGTFTSVAGPDGKAIEWLPLGGPTDLPCFVGRYGDGAVKIGFNTGSGLTTPTYEAARAQMWGKVRLETPVLYFYSDHDAVFNVHVDFPRGLITEYYPAPPPGSIQPVLNENSLRDPDASGYIEWKSVEVSPTFGTPFPMTTGPSHYYAARNTDATPLRTGSQYEKFLFYRGVAGFDVPISTIALDDGSVAIRNFGNHGSLPNVVLFENRGGRIGYRVNGVLRGDVTMPPLRLDGSLAALRGELAGMLVAAGLNEKEATAMVETWRDSWFEQGTRVFYIVPRPDVDAILPLRITPAPA